MMTGIAIHSSVQRYRMPTRFGIADHEITGGRPSALC